MAVAAVSSGPGRAMGRALALYADEPWRVRLHVRARHWLCPLERIGAYVPPRGRVLDVGCGHGLFASLLALEAPGRAVLGVDPMAGKIGVAQRAARAVPNVRFELGSAADVVESRWDAIAILDVLYLLPRPAKLALLEQCRALIAPGGVLLLKTNDQTPRWKYQWARLEERLMTGLGLTEGQGLYFLNAAQNRALLDLAGFDAEIVRLDTWLPYPHVLFVARPRPTAES